MMNSYSRHTPREPSQYAPVQSPQTIDIQVEGDLTPRENNYYPDVDPTMGDNRIPKLNVPENLETEALEGRKSSRRRKSKPRSHIDVEKNPSFLKALLMALPEDRCGRLAAILGILVFLTLVLGIFGILISLLAIHNDRGGATSVEIGEALDYIKENIQADLITDIQLVSSSASCPDGYERIALSRWPGTFNGCDCPDSLSIGSCPEGSTCTSVQGIDPIQILTWDDVQWCATKVSIGENATISSPCGSGFKECWAGYCIKNTLQCPVTDVVLTEVAINGSSKSYGTSKYYTLFRQRGKTGIVDIALSNNNISCFSEGQSPKGGTAYPLMRGYPAGGCEKYGFDNLFSAKLQASKLEDVLRENSFPDAVFELPGYLDILQATNVFLVARRKISIGSNTECYNIDFTRADETSQQLENFDNGVNACSLIALFAHAVVIIVIIGQGRHGDFKASAISFYSGFIIEIIVLIILVVLARNSYVEIMENRDYFKNILKLNCFTVGQPNQVISDLIEYMTGNGGLMVDLAMALLIMSVSSYVFLLMVGLFVTRKKGLL